MYKIWSLAGFVSYWASLPLIIIYSKLTKPRARVLIVHNGKVLVVKNWLGGGEWSLPGGGIENHETPSEAATREIKEELGFSIDPSALQSLGHYSSREKGGLHSKYELFAVELTELPKLSVKRLEIVDASWLSFTDLASVSKGVSNTVKLSIEVWLNR